MPSPLYDTAYQSMERQDFSDSFLESANISLNYDSTNLQRIPKEGACIVVVNSLFGTVDPLLLLKTISAVRSDVVVLTSFDFSSSSELDQHISFIDIESTEPMLISRFQNLLDQGLLVVVFPARKGAISRITSNMALDKRWHPKLMRVIYSLNTSVIPVYLSTASIVHLMHSKTFSFDRMTAIFHDLNDREKEVKVRIGKPIDTKAKTSFANAEVFSRYLRAKLYALGSPLDVSSFFSLKKFRPKTEVADPSALSLDSHLVEQEFERLSPECKVLSQGEFTIYLAPTTAIPIAIKEIGRLREVTFRAVGEGTGKAYDLDEYDVYYHQLVLWDHINKRIAGGYRIGFGEQIMKTHGKRGFYINSLFKLRKRFKEVLEQSLELGRSYVVPEYQKARLPLFLLWKGILSVILKHREYRYLIGPVSISNDYSTISRALIVAFINKFYWNAEMAEFVKPRKAFRPKQKDVDIDALLENTTPEMKDLDKLIEDIEPEQFKVPVLIKKYLKQEARIIGFNVDPKFSNALDGLMVLDMKDVPQETLENLNRDLN
ncbi:MAG: GNAT family N-acetyltransferase [Flavobacteriales bacterium]|nr:GNAT family N-acetyltransferase [Flavobacteriales bacterium]